MISRFHVKNYKCLRDVSVDLKPFTVLIGKNDTGKSSFLEAFQTLASLVGPAPDNWWTPPLEQLRWRGADLEMIEWEARVEPTPRNGLQVTANYHVGIVPTSKEKNEFFVGEEGLTAGDASIRAEKPDVSDLIVTEGKVGFKVSQFSDRTALLEARGRVRFDTFKAVSRALSSATKFRFDPRNLSSPADPGKFLRADLNQEPALMSDGYGLPVVLDYLLGSKRASFDAIEKDLRDAVPFVKSILLKSALIVQGGPIGKAISFELSESGYEVAAPLASDGVLLFLAYLTLVHSPSTPSMILLEEPENGIHPRQLQRIAEYLKRLTDPARGAKAVQIIVATHSPYFLDFVPPEDVLVFGRKQNGETVVAPILSLPGVQQRIESGFSLGEMWFNVGEDRLLQDLLK